MGIWVWWLLIEVVALACIIAGLVLTIEGDDGQPWPHPGDGDEHRWK